MLECQQRVFPYDYPETKAGRDLMESKGHKFLTNIYCPKPPSKRVNYQVIKQPCPFNPLTLHQINTFSNFVVLHPLSRGKPSTYSLIYLPTKDDIAALTKHLKGP